jgi:two-component system chemotaxis sensor kinase CheA
MLLRAYHEGGHVNIEVSDDGAGIDPEKIKRKAVEKGLARAEQAAVMSEWEALRLIFLPGFSTAEKITSISGRGVGMDVVKTNIEKIGGAVDLYNRPGAGSTIKIKIPLTLAIIPGLIVNLNSSRISSGVAGKHEDRFVIPQANLLELVRLEGAEDFKQVESIHGTQVYRRRGKLLPLTWLSKVLGLASASTEQDVLNIVIVQAEETAFGLIVDGVSDTQEIVVKALGKQLKALSCYVGATIMGDGKIALILDVPGLARLANLLPQALERGRAESKASDSSKDARQTLLLFSAGRFPRLVVPLSMVARLEEFPRSRVEYASGVPVLHYREFRPAACWTAAPTTCRWSGRRCRSSSSAKATATSGWWSTRSRTSSRRRSR